MTPRDLSDSELLAREYLDRLAERARRDPGWYDAISHPSADSLDQLARIQLQITDELLRRGRRLSRRERKDRRRAIERLAARAGVL